MQKQEEIGHDKVQLYGFTLTQEQAERADKLFRERCDELGLEANALHPTSHKIYAAQVMRDVLTSMPDTTQKEEPPPQTQTDIEYKTMIAALERSKNENPLNQKGIDKVASDTLNKINDSLN